MKYLFIILLLFPILIFGQNGQLGIVEYGFHIPHEKGLYKDATMYFNNSNTLFVYNKLDLKNDRQSIKSDGDAIYIQSNSEDVDGTQFYRDFINEETSFRKSKERLFEAYLVEDNWITIDWKIENKFKKIGKFKCQKAIGEFRGRVYTAWFTEEIPLPYGPWKLFGLPGLILEAEDSEKMLVVEFKGIQYPCDCEYTITKPNAKEVKSLQEYVEFRDNYTDLVLKKMQSKMPREMAGNLKKNPNAVDYGRKYRDEKIFEWEEGSN